MQQQPQGIHGGARYDDGHDRERKGVEGAGLFVEAHLQVFRHRTGFAAVVEGHHELLSLPGVGQTSALQLLGELALVPVDAEVRQWVAYAGLDPCECTSGSSLAKRPRISKVGNRHLRRALYMPALTAAHHHPAFGSYYRALQERGKCKMVALVAVMRKLLHAVFGMFKHDALFDGARVCPSLAVPTSVAA